MSKMTVKDALYGILTTLALLLIVFGVPYLLIWDAKEDQKRFDRDCEQIAKLAGTSDWQTNYSTCYIIKDNKIVKVGS